jgi:hypothetical protein
LLVIPQGSSDFNRSKALDPYRMTSQNKKGAGLASLVFGSYEMTGTSDRHAPAFIKVFTKA